MVDSHQVGEPMTTRSYSRSGHYIRDVDLAGPSPELGWDHAQDLAEGVRHRELIEPSGVARVGELDRREGHLAPSSSKHLGSRLENLQGLLGVGVVDDQNLRPHARLIHQRRLSSTGSSSTAAFFQARRCGAGAPTQAPAPRARPRASTSWSCAAPRSTPSGVFTIAASPVDPTLRPTAKARKTFPNPPKPHLV